jgi:hypothetical protein
VDEAEDERGLRRRQRALALIRRGAELTAPAAGGMVGLLGGPPGVLAGTSLGFAIREVLLRLGDEFEQRQLGPLEKRRAGAALYWALREVEGRLEDGEEPRSDDFFATDDTDRGRADELLEAVLTRAMHDHEERKLRHLGVMYGSLVFRDDIKPGHANFLVQLAARLIWEQLVLIALVHETPYRNLPDWTRFDPFSLNAHGPAGQLFDLARQGILVRTDNRPVTDISDVNPSFLQAATAGCLLVHLMRLGEIDQGILADAYEELKAVGKDLMDDEVAVRLLTAFDSEPVTEEDLDLGRIRVRATSLNKWMLPAAGERIEGTFHGTETTWSTETTTDPEVVALRPAEHDLEEFYATVETRQVLRVSKGNTGGLWLD